MVDLKKFNTVLEEAKDRILQNGDENLWHDLQNVQDEINQWIKDTQPPSEDENQKHEFPPKKYNKLKEAGGNPFCPYCWKAAGDVVSLVLYPPQERDEGKYICPNCQTLFGEEVESAINQSNS